MQYSRRYSTSSFSSYFPPGVKWLLIVNGAIFLFQYLSIVFLDWDPFRPFGLVPYQVVAQFAVWQLVTYMFLHGGIAHILFNLLALWMFGADLERDWGTRRFLRFYFLCGIGAGVSVILATLVFGGAMYRTIGASGAIYGILLAFGMLYPDRIVLFSFLFPMKAKWFVLITGVIVFLNSLQPGGQVSHVAHLGGMAFGYIYLKLTSRRRRAVVRTTPSISLRDRYERWKLERARRKFQVYMRRHESPKERDRDPWVH